ncbi:NAD(P)H-dependent glycerol-3-phosphate dehydrogenase [Azospirillum brasilense]|uniref:NAD(P)H-dependent glycerol-3-phosphate dehydrogenase n=1 Tax=Azospirillum brasilense TaxID=192 RepID=UPI00190A6554|nr:NAD(P)H-dependent glycerol-3-phosphate dehydrogenase [Azospirillum brasilense]MBK3735017.1 NAD(P)H-dependent glycerol-3-phosphate dehydrogenase [Azospirillum brasilense]
MAATDVRRIGVIGGGAWGTALALAALRAGREALLWAREPAVVESVNAARENRDYLPGVSLPAALRATGDLAGVAACDAILLVTPAQHLRSACAGLAGHLRPGTPLVICAKGIELDSHALMSEAAAAALPAGTPLAVLSGPTFAAEVARGLPTAVTLACADAALGARLVEALGSRTFRPYLSDDVVGSQIGGAVKNVLAIACGVVEGRKLGDNARAALITRGLAEITRLALALGGRPETLMGLSGLGDLTLTCSSLQSRNMSLGAALGAGRTLAEVLAERRSVAEGVYTAAAVVGLAGRKGVDMPLCAAVDAILNRGAGLDATIDGLLSRPFRGEGR